MPPSRQSSILNIEDLQVGGMVDKPHLPAWRILDEAPDFVFVTGFGFVFCDPNQEVGLELGRDDLHLELLKVVVMFDGGHFATL